MQTCLACGSDRLSRAEVVATSRLGEVWARAGQHGGERSPDQLRAFVRQDIAADEVTFWQCAGCGLQVADPMASWSAEHYPAEVHTLEFDHFEALAALATLPPRRVLDVGCGDGQFLARAAALGHTVMGIDFDPGDVAAVRRLGLEAHVGDFSQVQALIREQGREPFDVVTMFQVIEHLRDPAAVFAQLAGVVGPDAVLMVGTPSMLRYTRRLLGPRGVQVSDYWDYPPEHTLRWSEAALRAFLARHGWRVERVAYEPLAPVQAALHLTALDGLEHGWPRRHWRRGVRFAWWLARLAAARLGRRTTGPRIFVQARRVRAGVSGTRAA